MSEIADRYRRLSDAFAAKLAAVPPDRWASPSPCEGWTALEVVRHVVGSQGMFLGLVQREFGGIPSVDDDPAAAFDTARMVVQADLDDPAWAEEAFDGFFGRTTFEEAVDGFINFDLLVHGWDLARATGLDERIGAGDVAWLEGRVAALSGTLYSSGACRGPLAPPAGSDAQTRMLASVGRQAWA